MTNQKLWPNGLDLIDTNLKTETANERDERLAEEFRKSIEKSIEMGTVAVTTVFIAGRQSLRDEIEFKCCGGNDDTPKIHTQDCPAREEMSRGGSAREADCALKTVEYAEWETSGRSSRESFGGVCMEKVRVIEKSAYDAQQATIEELRASIEHAVKFMTASGYHEFDECEPEFQMVDDLSKTLARIKVK